MINIPLNDTSFYPYYYRAIMDELYTCKDNFYSVKHLVRDVKTFGNLGEELLEILLSGMADITEQTNYPYVERRTRFGVDFYKLTAIRRRIFDNPALLANEFHKLKIADPYDKLLFYEMVIDELYIIQDYFYTPRQLQKVIPTFRNIDIAILSMLLNELFLLSNDADQPVLEKRTLAGIVYFRLNSVTRVQMQKERKFNVGHKIKLFQEKSVLLKLWNYISYNYLLSGLILLAIAWIFIHYKIGIAN